MIWPARYLQHGLSGLLGVAIMGCATANDAADTQLARACVAEAGVPYGYQLNRVSTGGKTTITVPASSRVSPEQSAAINTCIAQNDTQNNTAAAAGTRPNYANAPAGFPTTAQACYNDYQQKRKDARAAGVFVPNGNALAVLIGTAIGKGIVSGVNERRYKECLMRVGATASEVAALQTQNTRRSSNPRTRQQSNAVMTGGAGYRISNAPQREYAPVATPPVRTPAKSAPRKTRTAQSAVGGTLPFPNSYATLRGDEALWRTLTLAQQRRALQFLQTGSTIRSSLQGD